MLMVHGANMKSKELIFNESSFLNNYTIEKRGGGHAVAQLVEALRYCGFDSRWCQEFLTQSFRPHYGPGVDSASNRNEY